MSDSTSEIWREWHRLHHQRSEESARRMADYDIGFHAELAKLRERCTALGHGNKRYTPTVLGNMREFCGCCGATISIENDSLTVLSGETFP